MSFTDPIGDMITRIRNAQMVKKETVDIPYSKIKYSIAQILERRGFVRGVELKGRTIKRVIELKLKYKDGKARVTGIKKISKPGQRMYSPVSKLHRVKGGTGIAILSTSKGLMSDVDARKENLGGEVIFQVW